MTNKEEDKKVYYTLCRQDDNGNVFVIQKNLSREKAMQMMKELEDRGHKQMYWIKGEQDSESGRGASEK